MALAEIEFEGLHKAIAKLGPELFRDPLRRAFDRSSQAVGAAMLPGIPAYTGHLRGSLQIELDQRGLLVDWARIGPRAKHTHFVEVGVRRHNPGFGRDARLAEWVAAKIAPPIVRSKRPRKGGRSDAEAALFQATFLIARSMARKGIKPRPFIRNAMRASKGTVVAAFAQMAREVEGAWLAS